MGEAPSPQTVSRVARSLDAEVRRFHRRPPERRVLLSLTGWHRAEGERSHTTGVKKRLVLCAYGITPQGERKIISFRQASAESEAQWEAFLRDLYDRGLNGNGLALVVTDGHPGLHRALDTVYPYVPRQRCWVHKLRNITAKLPRKVQKPCLKGAKEIYQAPTRREAVDCFRKWAKEWHPSQPKAGKLLGGRPG
jgi:putative transposase